MTLGTLAIRPVERRDLKEWYELWDAYNAFYGRSGETALPTEVTETTWRRFFDSQEPVHALVAERDGRIVGFAHYVFHRSTTQINLTCYLQDLFSHKAARRQGVGRALIEAVYKLAASAGSPRVYWQTHETNATAMRLYDRMAERPGFVIYRKSLLVP